MVCCGVVLVSVVGVDDGVVSVDCPEVCCEGVGVVVEGVVLASEVVDVVLDPSLVVFAVGV